MALRRQILESTATTGSEFRHPGGLAFILLSAHAGGTWKLQAKSANGEWVDVDGPGGVEFSESGYKAFYGGLVTEFRLTGGSVGAEAWLESGSPARFSSDVT